MLDKEFEQLILDPSKEIHGDILWIEDQDHSPALEFRVEVVSIAEYPLFIRGSFNALANTLTYALIHKGYGRIYALDIGKDHHNPSCNNVGELHKHRWTEKYRDKEAYVPTDITAPVNRPVEVWKQFCLEASITHYGIMKEPPPIQMDLII
ncbi:MAG: DUF6978 family protein [Phototrophicaceae bacterium]